MLNNLPVTIHNGIQVMSSVDLAKLCVGDAVNAHTNFMVKAKKVLGDTLLNFQERETYGNNNSRIILLLPEREACLMAMSYSDIENNRFLITKHPHSREVLRDAVKLVK